MFIYTVKCIYYTYTTTIKKANGDMVTSIDGTETPLEPTIYTITYTVKIDGQTKSITRTVTVQ